MFDSHNGSNTAEVVQRVNALTKQNLLKGQGGSNQYKGEISKMDEKHLPPEPVKTIVPNGVRSIAAQRYNRLRNDGLRTCMSDLAWRFHPRRWYSEYHFRQYHNKHLGKRCFIIGNGPSLNKMDLSPLKDEITFGLNRIYLIFPDTGFETTYLVSVNRLVIEQSAADLQALSMPKFFSWHARRYLENRRDIMYIRAKYGGVHDFSVDAPHRVWEGATVTYVAMQIAYYMGFSAVILIGVDHSFATKGAPNQEIISDGPDPNHFHPDYFGKGFRWQLPDLDTSENSYELARAHYQANGRTIVDATVGGRLEVFPKVNYSDLF